MDMKATLQMKKQMKYLLINSEYIQAYSEYAYEPGMVVGKLVPITKSENLNVHIQRLMEYQSTYL